MDAFSVEGVGAGNASVRLMGSVTVMLLEKTMPSGAVRLAEAALYVMLRSME